MPVPGLGPAALSQKEAAPQGLSRHPSLPGTPPGTHPAPVTPAGGGPDAARPGLQGHPVVQHPLQQPVGGSACWADLITAAALPGLGHPVPQQPQCLIQFRDCSTICSRRCVGLHALAAAAGVHRAWVCSLKLQLPLCVQFVTVLEQ